MTVLYSNNFDAETVGALPAGWANKVGTWVVKALTPVSGANAFGSSTNADADVVLYTGIAAVADMQVSTRQIANGATNTSLMGQVLRMDSTYSNGYLVILDSTFIDVFKRVGGTFTLLSQTAHGATWAAGATMYLRTKIVGSTITVYFGNGSYPTTATVTVTDASVTAAGYAGLYNAKAASGFTMTVDDFVIDDTAVAGTVPGAPTIGTATAGSGSASITFTAGTAGSTATTGYTATSTPGGFTGTSAASPITVAGLTNGTAYTFTVHATDTAGNSPESAASNSVTPAVAAATAIAVSGPSTGVSGIASSNFTVSANGTITGTVVVTPADGGAGGTFTPTTVSISSATPTATFTYTPSSAGAKTLSFTNNGALTNPANLTYTATANPFALIQFSPYNWYVTATSAKTINSGAYFKTVFSGSTCTLNFDMTGLVAPLPEILYRIDKYGAWFTAVLAATVVLTIPTDTSDYASKPGHYLEVIVKSTTETQSRWTPQTTAVVLTGITLATGGVLSLPTANQLNLLYYGDSITEGVRTVNGTATNDTDRNDASQGWAYRSAELLGAEAGVVGFGATGLITAGSGGVPAITTSYNLLYSGVSRVFTPAPDAIVINEGTNDGVGATTTAVTALLNGLLAATPATTKIIILRPFNGNQAANLQAGIAASTTPARCIYVDTTGYFTTANSFDALHPYGIENITHIAPLVAKAVRPYIVTASVKPTATKTISITLQNRAGTAQANLTGLSWEWSDTLGVVIDSGTGATTNATGVFSITTVHTNLAAAGVGYLKITNSNGTVNTTDVSGEFAVAVA